MTMIAEHGTAERDPWGALTRWVAQVWQGAGSDADTPEADRARRDFVDEMLSRNADAFASEADVQAMMQLYPGRF